MVATAVIFSSALPAMFGTFVKERFQRTYDAILAAPVDVEELVTAEMLWIGLRSGFYGCFPLIVSMFFGLDPAPGMLLVPLFCFITALGFAGFGIAVAASVAKIDQFSYVTTLFVTPLFLVAGTFFPIDQLPEGVQVASQLNPLHHLVELVRHACFGFEATDLLRVAVLIAFAIAVARGGQPHGEAADRLERSSRPRPACRRAPVDLRRHGHVLESDAERHVDLQAARARSLGTDHLGELRGVGRVAGEVALLAVVAVLGDVVDDEHRGVLEEVLGERGVEVDRARDHRVLQMRSPQRPLGTADDRGARDDHVRPGSDLLGRRRHLHLQLGVRRGQSLGAVAVAVEQGGAAERGEDLLGELEMHPPWRPQPRIPIVSTGPSASARIPSMLAAAVRSSVIQVASITASGRPVSASESTNRPWMYGMPSGWLLG